MVTPHIDHLVATGIELDRLYTYKFCSPSRSSLLTGRLPLHVNMHNLALEVPRAGIPLGMTTIAEKLRSVGYQTHAIGKWCAAPWRWITHGVASAATATRVCTDDLRRHCGVATPAQTPQGRGFEYAVAALPCPWCWKLEDRHGVYLTLPLAVQHLFRFF